MLYVRVIVLGHDPVELVITEKEDAFNAQLSDAVPPPARKFASVV